MSAAPRSMLAGVYSRLLTAARLRTLSPPLGRVDFGDLRRTTPISRIFGFDRGLPVDRYYIEQFLAEYASDVRGRVLEVGDRTYTQRFGGDAVTRSDVLHVDAGAPGATIVADLTDAREIDSNSFDCIILTQTLHFTYRLEAEVAELHRILKPGGVVLCTVPGISQISRFDMDRWGDFWRLTTLSARQLFETAFPAANVAVSSFGNVLAATALLQGIATEELTAAELDHNDPDYQVIVAVRAVKAPA